MKYSASVRRVEQKNPQAGLRCELGLPLTLTGAVLWDPGRGDDHDLEALQAEGKINVCGEVFFRDCLTRGLVNRHGPNQHPDLFKALML